MFPLSTLEPVGLTPDYEKGYKDGFNDARRAYEKRLKSLSKEMTSIVPLELVVTTATSSTKEEAPLPDLE